MQARGGARRASLPPTGLGGCMQACQLPAPCTHACLHHLRLRAPTSKSAATTVPLRLPVMARPPAAWWAPQGTRHQAATVQCKTVS